MLLKHINREIFSYGFTKNNHLRAKSIVYTNTYMMFDVHYDNHVYPVQTNLFGKHNIYNILAAVSVAIHLGIDTRKALKSLKLAKTFLNDTSFNCSTTSVFKNVFLAKILVLSFE